MDRVVIVTKLTRFEELVQKHFTEGAAQFFLESQGQSIESYREEHIVYEKALSAIRKQLPNDVPVAQVKRDALPHFLFRDKDLVIVCGPDGLFANLAKYMGDQPILGVNPDPTTIAGALMLFTPADVGRVVADVRAGKHHTEQLPFVKAAVGFDRVVWGINDIFIGRKDHVSARYKVSFGGREERHFSSGIIVSTGVGSTGWVRSVAAMVEGLTRPGQPNQLSQLPHATSDELVFVVREPFPSPGTGTSIVTGRVTPERPLTLVSEMPEGGYVFSDGIVERGVAWAAGNTVTITVGDRYVRRIVE